MHKYYDPRLFHVMDRDEILTEYAPKQREGVLLSETEVSNLLDGEKLKAALDAWATVSRDKGCISMQRTECRSQDRWLPLLQYLEFQ